MVPFVLVLASYDVKGQSKSYTTGITLKTTLDHRYEGDIDMLPIRKAEISPMTFLGMKRTPAPYRETIFSQ